MMWQQDLSEMESSSENIVDTQSSSSSGHSALLLPASPKSLLVPTYEDQQKWQEAEKKAADKDEGRSCNSYGHKAAEWYQAACAASSKISEATNITDRGGGSYHNNLGLAGGPPPPSATTTDQEEASAAFIPTNQPAPSCNTAAAAGATKNNQYPRSSAEMAQKFLGYQSQFPSLYRVGGGFGGMSAKRRKRAAQLGLVPPPNKNAVVALNELRPGLEYVVAEEKGPIHQPTFVIRITVNGQVFVGEGRSKKQAKHECAQKALDSFVQFRDAFEGVVNAASANGAGTPLPTGSTKDMMDFTSDQLPATDLGPLVTAFHKVETAVPKESEKPAQQGNKSKMRLKRKAKATTPLEDDDVEMKEISPASSAVPPSAKKPKIVGPSSKYTDKNPVMILNELRPGLKYEVSECGDSPTTKRFVMKVMIDETTYEGSGASKKLAKQACARAALTCVYQYTFTPHLTSGSGDEEQQNFVPGTTVPLSEFSLAQPTADRIGKLVMDRFSELISGHAQHSRRKVLAGVVMSTDGEAMEKMNIITVSTGTKCVNGEHMSDCGNALNDCHAEIVSRRCLVDFLYRNLELHLEDAAGGPGEIDNSVFVKNSPEAGGGYKLKDSIKFHLYINTAPCGDARIFSPHESNDSPTTTTTPSNANSENSASILDRHPNRKARGQLRTKIESGEGTIPVKSSAGVQTWDGVLQGSRLLTMSCSDKVAKWNVLGVQGSLLSHFVEPIYFHSITLGSLFHPNHMFRAVAGRIEGSVENLPSGFRLNIPRLNLLSSPEKRQPGKAPNYSVNWTTGLQDDQLEIIDAMKGKEQESGAPSRLAKVSFFRRFLNLVSHPEISMKTSIATNPSNVTSPNRSEMREALRQYSQAKATAISYQKAKEAFYQAFQKAQLGTWVKKPMEQDEFQL